MNSRKIIIFLMLSFLGLVLFRPESAGSAAADEYQVKAVFLLNFCKLSEWPRDSLHEKGVFPIAILGRMPSPAFERTLRDQTVHNATVTVRRIDDPEEARGCRAVFIAASERHRLSAILRGLRHFNVLTVSDIDDFCESGGMIGFVTGQNKIGFEVNLSSVRRVKISVGSRMLVLAKNIYGN
jgi:hypothetical protein